MPLPSNIHKRSYLHIQIIQILQNVLLHIYLHNRIVQILTNPELLCRRKSCCERQHNIYHKHQKSLIPKCVDIFISTYIQCLDCTVGVIRNETHVFVNFSAQDASILKCSVPIIKSTPSLQNSVYFERSYGNLKKIKDCKNNFD